MTAIILDNKTELTPVLIKCIHYAVGSIFVPIDRRISNLVSFIKDQVP